MKSKVSKKEKNEETEIKFTKKQIIESKKYRFYIDLLNYKLENDEQYSFKEIDEIVKKFKKGKV